MLVEKFPAFIFLLFKALQVVAEFELGREVAIATSDKYFGTTTLFKYPLNEFKEASARLDVFILDQLVDIVKEEEEVLTRLFHLFEEVSEEELLATLLVV